MVDIFGQFVCGLKQSQSGSRNLSPDHAAAAIVIAARSSRVNIDSPLGTGRGSHHRARAGDAAANDNKQQLLREQETWHRHRVKNYH